MEREKQKNSYTVEVVIPTYKPDEKLEILIHRLMKQTVLPEKIWIINTEKRYWCEDRFDDIDKLEVIHIKKEEFDHGGTRKYGAELVHSDIILFMTQDAMPENDNLIEELLIPFSSPKVAISYARQIPKRDAGIIEQYTRWFNYPPSSIIKSVQDIDEIGIKTFFCSNVCAAYRKNIYDELGGFVEKTIFNEDMIFAVSAIQANYYIAYTAGAKVIHSHHYTYLEQFKRNFDLGVSHCQYKKIFQDLDSESEGIRLVYKTAQYLIKKKKWYLLPDLIIQSGIKFLGYQIGKRYKLFPKEIILKCSMDRGYWKGSSYD